jgi:amino acid adenylation domain-containing protein
MFSWQNEDRSSLALEDITIEAMRDTNAFAKFDALLDLGESEGRLIGGINYATGLFNRNTIERWAGYLNRILVEMATDADRNIDALSMLPAAERHRMVTTWNDTAAPYPEHMCLHEPFEISAARTPDAPALRFEDDVLSYDALNRQANRLAHHLGSLGVGPGVRVAICVERAVEMVVGLLAILKAGGTYIPLDPAYPAERLAFMLADARPQVALTHAAARPVLEAALAALEAAPPVVVDLVADASVWAAQSEANLPVAQIGLDSRQLAYVIYTSGSTGKPKGIMVAHAPVINLIQWVNDTYAVDARDCLLFITSISFDLSVYDIFGILAAGGTIWLASQAMLADPERLTDALLDERVTFWDSAPAALQLLTPFLEQREQSNRALRLVFNSGDWIPLSLPGAIAARCPNMRFISLGGATEATIWSNHYEVHAMDPSWRSIPYGRPIRNARYYILDRHLQPVPTGVIGNLYIAGPCLAEGYTDQQLTRERFIDSPADDIPGPLYHTGDLARFYPDGNIEFIGRNDFQVKIRGFRIELGEIEAQLGACAGVREAVVLAREDVPGNKRLVAYYTTEPGAEVTVEGMLGHLTARLPEYMVPTAYLHLEAMPVTANGKLDRKVLPAPDGGAYLSRPYEAPVGEVEETLARIWSEILGVARVGRHDNFFELGGHSLLAVRVMEQMRRANLQTDIRTLFNTPVLSDIAANTQEYGEIFL